MTDGVNAALYWIDTNRLDDLKLVRAKLVGPVYCTCSSPVVAELYEVAGRQTLLMPRDDRIRE